MVKNPTTKPKISLSDWLHISLQRVAVLHFLLVIGYGAQLIIYDVSKVITPEVVLRRCLSGGALLAFSAVVWYLAHNQNNNVAAYKRLTFLLVAADIAFASFNIYTQRGMASRAVALYALAVATTAILLSRAALFTTAILCAAAYIATTVAYFTFNFNEGYKAELYGEVMFYSFLFFILAGLLATVVRFGGNSSNA